MRESFDQSWIFRALYSLSHIISHNVSPKKERLPFFRLERGLVRAAEGGTSPASKRFSFEWSNGSHEWISEELSFACGGLRGVFDGFDDVLITGAAAEIAVEPVPNLGS